MVAPDARRAGSPRPTRSRSSPRRERTRFDRLASLTPGWWAGYLSYDLGRAVERVHPRLADDLGLPDLRLARYDARAVSGPGGRRIEGRPGGRGASAGSTARPSASTRAGRRPRPDRAVAGHVRARPGRACRATSSRPRCAVIVALIEAGECYQVNLTRRLAWDAPADPAALFVAITRAPPRAATRRCCGSRSPTASTSRSCRRRPSGSSPGDGRSVETRPIKGTGRDADRLATSAKDRAENVMIVDLARNDLGRVCEPGSVHVPELCAPERHPGSRPSREHRARARCATTSTTPTSSGRRSHRRRSPARPSPRVLQAIEDLEPVRRGVYCGAIGWIDTERATRAISRSRSGRSPSRDGATFFGVGGGIVADSDPAAEWRETELKAARLLALAGAARDDRATGSTRKAVRAVHVWIDGSLVDVDDARISPFDHGLLVGDGVFETMRVYGGRPFAWRRHLDRLAASANGLGLTVPDRDALRDGGRRRCSRPTASSTGGCGSRSRAARRRSAPNVAPRPRR